MRGTSNRKMLLLRAVYITGLVDKMCAKLLLQAW
jgi:hypothetical protein